MVADKFGVGWMIIGGTEKPHERREQQCQPSSMTTKHDFVISRVFDAPRELVWKASPIPSA